MNRQDRILSALARLDAEQMEVLDESSAHNVPAGAESHFRVVVVSDSFIGKSRIERHRQINRALAAELNSGLHALAIDAFTPDEWSQRGGPKLSPDCLGGMKREGRI